MSTTKFHPRNIVLLCIILLIAGVRVVNNFSTTITVLANYSPLAAMALFGGAYFKGNIKPLIFPLMAIFISDVILFATVYKSYGNGFLYSGWYWVYASFVLMVLCSKIIIKKVTMQRVALAIVVSIFIHWVVSDIGEFIGSTTYPQTWAGFNACLAAAIPYELRLLTSTIIYSAIMFGAFELMQRRYAALKVA